MSSPQDTSNNKDNKKLNVIRYFNYLIFIKENYLHDVYFCMLFVDKITFEISTKLGAKQARCFVRPDFDINGLL